MRHLPKCVVICVAFMALPRCHAWDQPTQVEWQAGFSRVDVTPTEPVRMSGYGNRDRPSEGVDTPLYVRCIALQQQNDPQRSLLISIDSIGLTGALTRELADAIEERHGIPRQNVVFCSTHTHTGPHLSGQLTNIFSTPLTDEESAAADRYTTKLGEGLIQAVEDALANLAPATISCGGGEVDFAANRRALKNGSWSGFGVQADAPVDHTVNVLRVADSEGKVRGIVFNYACHCTTLTGSDYKINGDWAGYAASQLEATHDGAVALCTIGCGGDQNPNPRGSIELAQLHGRTLASEISRVIASELSEVDQPLQTRFDYAGLTFDLPTEEELRAQASGGKTAQSRRHAEHLLEILKRDHRLPATYPVPIQSWRFGDRLTMIFLGGEVVVDYAIRLKKVFDDSDLWVTAYANDVLGYIASERMRTEGGYEYDRSGVYYSLPGPWASGTEDFLVRRVKELVESRDRAKPLAPSDALKSFELTDGFEIELVASEPLVADPVNIAFDRNGRLWVVQMGDYPEGKNLGSVLTLTDENGDGVYDRSTEFLSGLAFPTGVFPWRDGVLISCAPDILFASDTDGDGKADEVGPIYTGFRLANPQHRINGFSYGLDHSLHLASGDNLGELESKITGEKVNASGHDVQIWPDDGRIAVTSGRTQYIRSRNDWGQWFGNDNSRPMYHFPIEDAYLDRNDALSSSNHAQQLFDPPVAPPIFALTQTSERFNDLFAAGRFTSACSAIVARSPKFDSEAGGDDVAFICEPVHNLVHRARLEPVGATFRATRLPSETKSEFLRSTDPWFRPARAMIGPNGDLYVVDMYRETIEHPEWIPDAWQAKLDLTAGSDRGRIYRIRPSKSATKSIQLDGKATLADWISRLESPYGTMRDMAQQALIESEHPKLREALTAFLETTRSPQAQVHALSILSVTGTPGAKYVGAALRSSHPGVVVTAIRIAAEQLQTVKDQRIVSSIFKIFDQMVQRGDPTINLALALAMGEFESPEAARVLGAIAVRPETDRWIARAIVSSASVHAEAIIPAFFEAMESDGHASPERLDLMTDLFRTVASRPGDVVTRFSKSIDEMEVPGAVRMQIASCLMRAIRSSNTQRDSLAGSFSVLYDQAKETVKDSKLSESHRCDALSLFGLGIGTEDSEIALLTSLVTPGSPAELQQRSVDCLVPAMDPSQCESLFDRWSEMSDSVRQHFVSRMLQNRKWTLRLFEALESDQIRVSDLTVAARQRLAHTGSRSMRVRAERLTRSGGSKEKRELVQTYLQAVGRDRDLSVGESLFQKHCAVCHVAKDDAPAVGASLVNLTDRTDLALLTAILDPNRAADPQYVSYLVRTEDDRVLAGTIESESGNSLTLAHADGKRTTIRRERIVEMKNSGLSLMPEGFESAMTPDQIGHLLGYLQQLR